VGRLVLRGQELSAGVFEAIFEMSKRSRSKRSGEWSNGSEARGELVDGADHDTDVAWLLKVVDEGRLGGEVFEITAEVLAARSTAHRLVLSAEEVFGGVVGSVDNEQYFSRGVTDNGMPEKLAFDTIDDLEN